MAPQPGRDRRTPAQSGLDLLRESGEFLWDMRNSMTQQRRFTAEFKDEAFDWLGQADSRSVRLPMILGLGSRHWVNGSAAAGIGTKRMPWHRRRLKSRPN